MGQKGIQHNIDKKKKSSQLPTVIPKILKNKCRDLIKKRKHCWHLVRKKKEKTLLTVQKEDCRNKAAFDKQARKIQVNSPFPKKRFPPTTDGTKYVP